MIIGGGPGRTRAAGLLHSPISIPRQPMFPPPQVSVHEVAEQLASETPPRLVDVREPVEIDIVQLEGSLRFTEELAQEIIDTWPPDTPIVVYCHHGVRSMNAAMFLSTKGLTNVVSMSGGIDAWAQEIDTSLPRY